MDLPFLGKKELEEEAEKLRERIEELEEEKEALKQRYEKEQERRSKLARKKQEAEEELNRLEDRLEGLKAEEEEKQEDTERSFEPLSLEKTRSLLEKLDSLEGENLATVYVDGDIEEVDDFRGLKNSVSGEEMLEIRNLGTGAAFIDRDIPSTLLKTRPFFGPRWGSGNSFEVEEILDFIERKKIWALVSAGETVIFEEENGNYKQIDRITSRVDREHSGGGYSQDRFERKREEQIQEHLDQVEEALEDRDNVYLLGEKSHCQRLPGKYLGGFDPNTGKPEVFYSFRRRFF